MEDNERISDLKERYTKVYKEFSKESRKNIKDMNSILKKMASEYGKIHEKKILDILKCISENENLDYNYLINKYTKIDEPKNSELIEDTEEEEVLDKIILDGIEYYYENKEDGRIFLNDETGAKLVGRYINKEFTLNK